MRMCDSFFNVFFPSMPQVLLNMNKLAAACPLRLDVIEKDIGIDPATAIGRKVHVSGVCVVFSFPSLYHLVIDIFFYFYFYF